MIMSFSKSCTAQCLSIPELQLMIFGSLTRNSETDSEVSLDKSTLARLARTSRQFHDSAITLLWKEQTSLAPLIQVMPDDLWEVNTIKWRKMKQISLRRPIVDNDWERLDHYSLKIHDITLSVDIGVNKTTLAQLAAYRPVKLILPQLNSLTLDCEDSAEPFVEYLPSLLGESLRQLRISFHSPEYDDELYMQHFLYSVPNCCPKLTHLDISEIIEDVLESTPDLNLSTYLSAFAGLEFLSISHRHVSPEVMTALGGLKTLQSVSLGLISDLEWKWEEPFEPSDFGDLSLNPLFASPDTILRSIKMDGSLVEDVVSILNAAPPSLRRFQVSGVGGKALLRELIEPLFRFTDMTSIILNYDGVIFDQTDEMSATLSPLLSLQNLAHVKIRGLHGSVLNDPWLIQASIAWPALATLDLVQSPIDKPSITLEGLVPIALNCKRLVRLTIGAICRPFNVAQLKLKPEPLASNLQELVFMRSMLERPWGVMRCVSLLFPSLKYAKGSGLLCDEGDDDDSDEDKDDEWKVLNGGFTEAFS